MQPNAFLATLSASLATNGSETEVFLSNITTLTGETVTTAQFATFGRGILTIDPLSSVNIEFVSFTGVDSSGIGFTGLSRGLSALSNSSITANKKYHPAGTQVILAWGIHNLLDLQTYITNAVSGSLGTATDVTAGSTKLTVNMGANARARSSLVTQNSTPNMTVYVQPFSYVNGTTTITFAGGNTSSMTAPVSNPRYDLIVYRTSALAIVTGVEGSSPNLPTASNGDIVLASIFHRVGETTIIDRNVSPNTQGYIASWYEPTIYNTAVNLVASQVVGSYDQAQSTENATQAVGKANTTGNPSIVAQKFVPTTTGISGVRLYKIADTGTFTGGVVIALQADSSGSPSGSNLASYTISNAAWLKLTAATTFAVSFSSEYESMVLGNPYWIVISPSTSDSSNHPNLGLNTGGGYASGALKYNNSADGWVLVATSMLYFQTLGGVLGKIVQTDPTSGLVPPLVRPYSFVKADNTTTSSSGTVFSAQLDGGFFSLNSGLHLRVQMQVGGSAGVTSVPITLKYNGTTLLTFTTGATAALTSGADGANTIQYNIDFYVVNQNSLSSQVTYVTAWGLTTAINAHNSTFTTSANYGFSTATSGTSAIDTSQPGLLELAFASGTFTYNLAILEKIG